MGIAVQGTTSYAYKPTTNERETVRSVKCVRIVVVSRPIIRNMEVGEGKCQNPKMPSAYNINGNKGTGNPGVAFGVFYAGNYAVKQGRLL